MEPIVSRNGHEVNVERYQNLLIEWGAENFRSFPWRSTRDLYKLLMAEFMLLRTRASQVADVYPDFIQRYPTVSVLSKASREDVHSALQSLGLQWRADYVFETANEIMEEYGGSVPHGFDQLCSLPGVSHYIAGAVRCFGLGKPERLIDTNTLRISSRLFLLATTDSSRRSSKFRQLLDALLDESRPREYNYALLDLAAKICTSRKPPACHDCPIREVCAYGQSKQS